MEPSLLIVTGKGGTGRSALTAALALRSARLGKRVLAIAMTDGDGLAAHLSAEHLGYQAHEVRDGLWAMEVDPAAALEEYLRLQLHVPLLGPPVRGLAVLAETVPGIRDTVVIGKVLFEARSGEWDLIVADGPPTGQVVSYLRAPSTIEGMVPSGRVRSQAAWMRALLADPDRAGLILTATPEELPVAEARETLAALDAEPLVPVDAVVLNRVLPAPEFAREEVESLPDGPTRQAALLHLAVTESQQEWLSALPEPARLPYLFGVHTPAEVAVHLADLWEGAA